MKWNSYARERGQQLNSGNMCEMKMAMEGCNKSPDAQLKLLRSQLKSVKCSMMMCIFDDRKEMMDFFDDVW